VTSLATDLTGRVAVVTGSSRGLGAATARTLAGLGADVVVTYRREEEQARSVADAVRAQGRAAWVRSLDVGDATSVDDLFDWLSGADGPGRLDVLVANAAATSLKPLLEQKPHNSRRTFDICVTGFLQMVQRSVPVMEAGGRGRIVVVSGIDTVSWAPAHGLLGAAKAAMETLVRYLAIELADTAVTIVGINPDAFFGESMRLMFGDYYEPLMDRFGRTHPLRRSATPDDIAEAVALLCTDAALWLTGNTVMADGASTFAARGVLLAREGEAVSRRMEGRAGPSVPDLGGSA
jgi:enoyl-[acyl-carrier protein] reductase III